MRNDKGLNIIIRDDARIRNTVPEGVRHANALDMNIFYIDLQ